MGLDNTLLNTFWNDDWLEFAGAIPDGAIDAIITDPPYGTTSIEWDKAPDLDAMFNEFWRILKPNGVIVVFAQNMFTAELMLHERDNYKYRWFWDKRRGVNFHQLKKMPLRTVEEILLFSKVANGNYTYNPQKSRGKLLSSAGKTRRVSKNITLNGHRAQKDYLTPQDEGLYRHPTDILRFSVDQDTAHPTSKPVDLLRYLVRTYTNPNELVFDPFGGIATTARACVLENRRYISAEINPEYHKAGFERIELAKQEARQIDLFRQLEQQQIDAIMESNNNRLFE